MGISHITKKRNLAFKVKYIFIAAYLDGSSDTFRLIQVNHLPTGKKSLKGFAKLGLLRMHQ
jgi:two-component SAPR family response regulator